MPNSADFVDHVLDLMRPAAKASARSMFGGHGIYVDGRMVALVADDVLYFKCDDVNRPTFEALGLPPFDYETRDGRRVVMSYYRAPDEAVESSAAMREWLQSARAAALRAGAARPTRRAKSSPGVRRRA